MTNSFFLMVNDDKFYVYIHIHTFVYAYIYTG